MTLDDVSGSHLDCAPRSWRVARGDEDHAGAGAERVALFFDTSEGAASALTHLRAGTIAFREAFCRLTTK